MEIPAGIFFIVTLIIPMSICIGVMYLIKSFNEKRRVFPFDIATTARTPGHSLISQIIDSTWNIAFNIMFIFFSFVLPFAIAGFSFYAGNPVASLPTTIFISICIFIFFGVKLLKELSKLKQLRIGLEAEWAVGIKLNELQQLGYNVFHDVQADNFNIDHLVVGANGVFAIETKGRSKPLVKGKNKTREKQFNVLVKGTQLEFPTWQDSKSIEQAIRQSKWVSNWLTKSTGQEVHAAAVLIIPGWFIERKEKPIIPVLPLNNLNKTFPRLSGKQLDNTTIEKICYQVEQRVKRGDDTL
jgi:hypothetical protein